MEDILSQADALLKSGSSEDIQNFLPELASALVKLDYMTTANDISADKLKIQTYIKLKKEKKDGNNTYSDKDIEILCKNKVMEQFGDVELDKRTVKHIELYLDLLKQRKIDLATTAKQLREGVNF